MEQDRVDIQAIEHGFENSMSSYERATLGMGCFWGPEARFGSLPGVIRTRVGFAGGTAPNPTYRNLGDHTETVEIDFNPEVLNFEDVLLHFWKNHYPNRDNYKGRQYISLLRYHSGEQKEAIDKVKAGMEKELGEAIETDIAPFNGFTLAEERHQKYYLKRYPKALDQLEILYPSPELLVDSTFAARLNGFVKGFGNREALKLEIAGWPIKEEHRQYLIDLLFQLKW
ncbi:peptide-methionine (S)-S-oxide reductase [Planomicrobium sp. CPCC 101079]|uniref:peptide-methionine (S)-S-oxide reductase MsrA n=1 Tax=Planomicrobium sp. CPCC 101079 TaxID=2599618 RepID=UPI0011B7A241|nr:peptide-methionine (S)-S-oxide reductase [Planomicrobium sp. CPCC 101079]TWT16030.1 peptide-methionine (S)-S-oxide reductase [Planomicrobium sp. CPCC 101079]